MEEQKRNIHKRNIHRDLCSGLLNASRGDVLRDVFVYVWEINEMKTEDVEYIYVRRRHMYHEKGFNWKYTSKEILIS